MRDDFEPSLRHVLADEGGWSDDPDDDGGPTMYGVTQPPYDEWRTRHGLPTQPVQAITRDEARSVYLDLFWTPAGGDVLPPPLDLVVFDAAVQHGPAEAVRMLQGALGVPQDGGIGPVTLGALAGRDAAAVARLVLDKREALYRWLAANKPGKAKFLHGWLNRIGRLRSALPAVVSSGAGALLGAVLLSALGAALTA